MQEEDQIEPVTSAPQIREVLPLQKIAWKIQKVCWVIIVAIMLLIALGLFGNGPISKTTETKKNITLEYERFSRSQASTTISVYFAPAERDAVIGIPLQYLSRFELETVFPESYETKIEGNAIYYTFDTPDNAPLKVQLFVHPQNHGVVKGNWTINGSDFPITHLIYP